MRQIISIVLCLLALTATAQKPTIRSFSSKGYIIGKMSDNGKWVTQYQEIDVSSSSQLINLETYEIIDIQSSADISQHGVATLIDVTDDGNILVGSYENRPAYYNRQSGTWTQLSTQYGCVRAVTPDGHYAVGATNNGGDSGYEIGWYTASYPKMWDLTTNEEVYISELALPASDPKGNTGGMMSFVDITADGRYILGNLFVDYPDYAFIFDRNANNGNGDFKFIGYRTNADGMSFTPTLNNLYFNEPHSFSPNGKWVVCNGYFVDTTEEFTAAVRYNMETGETIAYNTNNDDKNMYANVIDNNGNVYGGTPSGTPIREFYIRNGNYWYSLRSVLSQKYGMNFEEASGLDNTGTPCSISADGLTITSMVDPQYGQNMVIKLCDNLADVCNGLNLLGVYSFSPAEGAQFSTLSSIRITFDRDVEVVGAQTAATFGSWNSLSGNGLYVDPVDSKTVVAAFRTRTLEDGKEYTFKIPAGTICIAGDRSRTNDDIISTFHGRNNAPVKVVSTYPEDGSTVSKIDNTGSPILLTMDCNVVVTDDASATLYTADGKRVCALTVAYLGNSVALYPATTQYLYAGSQYTVVLSAGSVTDVMGGGGNEEFRLTLYGNYEREQGVNGGELFSDDFNNISNSLATWLLFEGDGQTPNEEMTQFEFDTENTPWNFSIHEDISSTDYCAASHSCYTPSGQSLDWMFTPQIFIPDNLCRLSFQAQSYRSTKQDYLQVYVWAYDENLAFIGEDEYFGMKENGKRVVNARLTPGKSEDELADDWQTFDIDLSEFAGKNIYICFGNENTDQSMIFVDNVLVYRQMTFELSLSTPEAVVGASSAAIEGKIKITDKENTYSSLSLTLKDSDGNIVSTTSADGLNLKLGDSRDFRFDKELPLTTGDINHYTIDVTLNGVSTSVGCSIKNLVFMPTKHVVLEENTGVTCGNCPQGILAIEQMERIYGKQFIPISIHTYSGDSWGNGLTGYSSFLGLSAAPTAIIQRSTGIVLPMTTDDDFNFTFTYRGSLWMDKVAEEMDKATELDITAHVEYDADNNIFTVPVKVRSAMNVSNQNINIFMVLMEDGLQSFQENYFASSTDPLLGPWGLGGKWGQGQAYGVTHNDVVRYCYGTTYAGTGGLLPQTMSAGREYEPSEVLGGTVPGTVENVMNAKIAVLLIDTNTDRIINACVAHFDSSKDEDAITQVRGDENATTTYSLQGQIVRSNYKGIVIRNGKKVVLR